MTTKKLMPIAAALLFVAIAAAIFASGNALSFSLPTSDKDAPAAQQQNIPPQPQDFVDDESRYFGPDFMCLIYSNDTIECFGSDADDIVSDAPTKSGFTRIDGGDTYVCAYHQSDAFTHCWGSITRSPSAAAATPTPTRQPRATPTPTSVPPGVNTPTPTPTPMSISRGSCHIPRSGSATYPLTLTGTWTSSCTLASGTPYIWDEWRQQGTGAVTITARSDADPNLTLYEINDSILPGDDGWATLLAYNDDIDTAGGDYDAQIVYTLEDGKHYWVSVKPYNDDSRDSFTLTYTSTASGLGWAASVDLGGLTPLLQAEMQSLIQPAATK